MKKNNRWLLFVSFVLCALSTPGCQPSYSTELSVALTPPPADEAADPNTPAPQPVDPLDVLAAVEKIAGKNGLERYTPDDAEASLLDLADTDDLLADSSAASTHTTHWKHPDLPVYLTVTRNPDDILLLVHHSPGPNGKPNPNAKKHYDTLIQQLNAQWPEE